MKRKVGLDFKLSFSDVKPVDKRFAKTAVAIAYAGKNRNGSVIDKETFERALPSIKNIPMVTNYDISADKLGGHDLEIVTDSKGELQIINATVPFGVVPESAQQWWETREDGREYLMTEALLWTRCPATQHIVDKGQVDQSMEIEIEDGNYYTNDDKDLVITAFDFSALCAIGVEPCFEAASIQLASERALSSFTKQFSLLLNDLKTFTLEEGGKADLIDEIEKMEILEETEEDVAVTEVEQETETAEFELEEADEEGIEETPESVVDEVPAHKQFAATYNEKLNALTSLFCDKEETDEDGKVVSYTSYWVFDFSEENVFVNVGLYKDGNYNSQAYRYPYSYNEAERTAYLTGEAVKVFARYLTSDEIAKMDEDKHKFQMMREEFEDYKTNHSVSNEEAELLRKFKEETEKTVRDNAVNELFSMFDEDLGDMEEYVALKANCDEMTVEAIENHCFMLKGRKSFTKKTAKRSPKLKVEDGTPVVQSPYGDLF